ncbi:MAG: hypothetical protein LBP87_00250 [Planctomycetaceae bacterium]|nr:hypothetical protein [Planctomycetaceae bacterium]
MSIRSPKMYNGNLPVIVSISDGQHGNNFYNIPKMTGYQKPCRHLLFQ